MNETLDIPPMVSIVIPVYNGSNFLRQAIESALAQTYNNCEIIVVNDGSTDNTEQICLNYANHIRYFYKENGGVATALNLAIDHMRGEYFSWLSHDDLYYPDKVQCQMEALTACGNMTKIVIGDFHFLDQRTKEVRPFILKNEASLKEITTSVSPVVKSLIGGCALLIHRSHFKRVGVFSPKLKYTQDYDLWFRMFRHQELVYVNKPLYLSRLHDKQDTRDKMSACHEADIQLWRTYIKELTVDEINNLFGCRFLFLFELWQRTEDYGTPDKEFLDLLLAETRTQDIGNKFIKSLNQLAPIKSVRIAIWGTGYQGLRTYKMLRFCGIKIEYFIDSNQEKHNKTIIDYITCISSEEAMTEKNSIIIIIAVIKGRDEIISLLKEKQFPYFLDNRQLKQLVYTKAVSS